MTAESANKKPAVNVLIKRIYGVAPDSESSGLPECSANQVVAARVAAKVFARAALTPESSACPSSFRLSVSTESR